MANWTGNAYVDSLLLGEKWDTNTLTYFLKGGASTWNAIETTSIQEAFTAWENVANISFSQTLSATGADFVEDQTADFAGNLGVHEVHINYGTTTLQTNGSQLNGQYNYLGYGWDENDANGGLQVGGLGYLTLLHEIGHGLGIDHTHDDGGGNVNFFPGVSSPADSGDNALNQDVYSIMSYVHGAVGKYIDGNASADNYGFVSGPMAFDIAAIQYEYGANLSKNNGDNTYILPDADQAGTFFSAIWDTGGTDEIVYQGSKATTIDLRSATLANEVGGGGFLSQAGGIWGGFTIAADFTNALTDVNGETGVIIENATGGSGIDIITGNQVANVLTGNAGDDRISAGGGNDTLNGNAGSDSLFGGSGADTLNGGAGADTLDAGHFTGLSSEQGQVFRLYRATLDRAPDAGGFTYWSEQLDIGSTLASITSGFVNSSEFQTTYGSLNNNAFVNLLYQNVLNRGGDASGLTYWTGQLEAGASRESIVNGFSESAEFQNNTNLSVLAFVDINDFDNSSSNPFDAAQFDTLINSYTDHMGQAFRLYQATLDRAPDAGGFTYWSEQLDIGSTLASITSGFVNSSEFQTTYGSLNNDAFVNLLYQNVLNRGGDASGLTYWTGQLEAGASRESIVNGFSESAEFQNNTSPTLESYLRTATSLQNTLEGGAGDDLLIGGRGNDTFIFNAADDGVDTVYGLQSWDSLQFTGFNYSTASDALVHITQNGNDVLFSDQGVNITFTNTLIADFGVDMFTFA